MASRRLPQATVDRLPVYLRSLAAEAERDVPTVSSERLAELAGVNAAKVRKDLSYLGSFGTRGVGYDVPSLLIRIRRELGLTKEWKVAIVGVGNLGRALAGFQGFQARGFSIEILCDDDQAKLGTMIAGVEVRPTAELIPSCLAAGVGIGVICTPAEVAQDVADDLVEGGVTSILNFAPAVLSLPDHVAVRKVDLSLELQVLAYHLHQSSAATTDAASA